MIPLKDALVNQWERAQMTATHTRIPPPITELTWYEDPMGFQPTTNTEPRTALELQRMQETYVQDHAAQPTSPRGQRSPVFYTAKDRYNMDPPQQ